MWIRIICIRVIFMKKYIPKVMLLFALSFFVLALFTVVYHAGYRLSLDHNQQMRLILQFVSAGLFLGLYRIIDLLEKK